MKRDLIRQRLRAVTVVGYVLLVGLIAIQSILLADTTSNANDLKDLVPLFGIPKAVITWSLIGSFAAMVYSFNKKNIYEFGDTVKWLITRPIQGVILGSTFYLILTAGLYLVSGSSVSPNSEESATTTANEIILVLIFLISFSDRVADSVFNTLIETYSGKAQTDREDK